LYSTSTYITWATEANASRSKHKNKTSSSSISIAWSPWHLSRRRAPMFWWCSWLLSWPWPWSSHLAMQVMHAHWPVPYSHNVHYFTMFIYTGCVLHVLLLCLCSSNSVLYAWSGLRDRGVRDGMRPSTRSLLPKWSSDVLLLRWSSSAIIPDGAGE
jgi:hypothetical protein